MRTRTATALLTLTAALSLSACGGSDGLERAELAKQADAICDRTKAEAVKVSQPADFATNGEAAAEYLGKIEAITRDQQTELAKLTPADDVKADYDAMVRAQGKLADLLGSIVAKAKAKDSSGGQDLARAADVSRPFVEAANAIGATSCAKG